MPRKTLYMPVLVLSLVLFSCAPVPVRDAVKIDYSRPIGKIQNNQFVGIRYPFRVAAPAGWKLSMEVPEFMEDFGYEKEGLKESELFLFHPSTRSNVQIDFVTADRYSVFSQARIEGLTSSVGESFKEELREDYGKDLRVDLSPTEPVMLKGVQYAAKKYATYTVKGVKREQGWIYAFAEPYQIFILYMLLDTGGENDREALNKALMSFEVVPRE